MIIRIHQPSIFLFEYIKYYWILENTSTEYTELVFPTGEIQILFHCQNPFIENKSNGEIVRQPSFLVCGQKTIYSNIKSSVPSYSIGVVFYPYSASLFFPFSLDEINDYSIKIFDIFKDWSEYEDNFFSSTDAVQRIRIIEKFLLKKIINRNYQQYELVKSCINEITKAKGTLPLNNIYSHYNVSEKTIQRLFKQYVGITPKMFSEYIRIGNTVELVKSKMNSTEVSYEAGYYDQSHCIKKLKTYTGCTPIELIKKCDNSDVVFIQSN